MGVTVVEATVRGPQGDEATLPLLVDGGAQYTVLPKNIWRQLKLKPKRQARFSLVDGTVIDRDVGECHISLSVGEGHTPVVLGQPGDEALLGVVTLEELGLVLNPFSRELQPMKLMM